ncbi:flagellar hook-length control protein FliK [Caulobacter sp. NIBR2454]|uniref:flagellar hook-length control protein FliK n=1 Tax=Caulobacter sp. NIBR2454 TaxID=3015996 RepID=UPI0022B64DB7|nr:flagellar hook-length control protein FliK [Caulobacter sp. NIBR2454]
MTEAVSAAAAGAATAAPQGGGQATSAGAGFDLLLALMAQVGTAAGGMDGEGASADGKTPVLAEDAGAELLGSQTDAAAVMMGALLAPQLTTTVQAQTPVDAALVDAAAPTILGAPPVAEELPETSVAKTVGEAVAEETVAAAPQGAASTEDTAQVSAPSTAANANAAAAPAPAQKAATPADTDQTAKAVAASAQAAAHKTAASSHPQTQVDAASSPEAPTGEAADASVTILGRREAAAPASETALEPAKDAKPVAKTATPSAQVAQPDIVDAAEPVAQPVATQASASEDVATATASQPTAVAQQAAVASAAPRAPAAPQAGESLRSRRFDTENTQTAGAVRDSAPMAAKAAGAAKGAPAAQQDPFAITADPSSAPQSQGELAVAEALDPMEPASADTATGTTSAAASTTTSETARIEAAAVRGSPETVAQLSAQIAKKLENKITRFDIALDPVDLGKVNVKLEIDRDGRVTAAMSFEKPQAASELRARSSELREALEKAGFDLAQEALTFDLADQGGSSNAWAQQQTFGDDRQTGWNGRAFQAALNADDEPPITNSALDWRASRASGVDVRI